MNIEDTYIYLDYFGKPRYFAKAYNNKIEEIEKLFKDPKNIELINTKIPRQSNQTTLQALLYKAENLPASELFINSGAVDSIDDCGRSVAHYAANAASKALSLILKKIPELTAYTLDNQRRTLVHALCMPGSSDAEKGSPDDINSALKILIGEFDIENSDNEQKQKDLLQQPDIFGVTPLMYAKYYRDLYKNLNNDNMKYKFNEILTFAFDNFDINEENISNQIPSEAVAVDFFGRKNIHTAAYAGNVDLINNILNDEATGPDITNVPNRQFGGMTALHYAVLGNSNDAVKAILEHTSTDVTIKDIKGSNVLHYAAFKVNPEIFSTLLQKNSVKELINQTDDEGNTPLHVLAMSKNTTRMQKCLEILSDNGADFRMPNKQGHIPYDIANIIENKTFMNWYQENIVTNHSENQIQQSSQSDWVSNIPRTCLSYFYYVKSTIANSMGSCFGLTDSTQDTPAVTAIVTPDEQVSSENSPTNTRKSKLA